MEEFKQDINFLEKPIWFLTQKSGEEGKVWKDIEGYEYRAGYKLPDEIDILFLMYFFLRSQEKNFKQHMIFTRYEVVKACGLTLCKQNYERLEDSLKRWVSVTIAFKGTFYDGKEYKSILFHILETAKIRKEDGRIELTFNADFLLKIKESKFFKYINFDHYRSLKRSVSRRLFEILCKSFKGRIFWKIDLVKLGIKLTLSKRKVPSPQGELKEVMFHSDVLVAIKPAINEINKLANNKDLLKALDVDKRDAFQIDYKMDSKKKIICFTKKTPKWILQEQEAQKASEIKEESVSIENTATLQELYEMAKSQTKAVQEMIAKAFREKGFDYVKWNILYSNKEAKTNYAVFLKKALEENWGMEIQEVENTREKTEQTHREEKNKQLEDSQKKNEEILRLNKEFYALPSQQQKQLREQAIDSYLKAGVPENFKIPNEMILAKVRDLLKSKR